MARIAAWLGEPVSAGWERRHLVMIYVFGTMGIVVLPLIERIT